MTNGRAKRLERVVSWPLILRNVVNRLSGVEGLDHAPADGAFVLVPNHTGYTDGAFRFGVLGDVPVIPVGIHGSNDILPRGATRSSRAKARVVFGPRRRSASSHPQRVHHARRPARHDVARRLARSPGRQPAACLSAVQARGPRNAPPAYRQAELSKTLLGAAQPEEMARIATFLASDAASYINATVVHVNRGMEF